MNLPFLFVPVKDNFQCSWLWTFEGDKVAISDVAGGAHSEPRTETADWSSIYSASGEDVYY